MKDQKFVIQPDKARASSIEKIVNYMRSLPVDKPFSVTIGKLVRERTNKQNAALWGLAYPIIKNETGNSPDDMHRHFCIEFFGSKELNINGQFDIKPRRTTTHDKDGHKDVIDTEEFYNFFLLVQSQSAEYGVDIPDPSPEWKRDMQEQILKERAARAAKTNDILP